MNLKFATIVIVLASTAFIAPQDTQLTEAQSNLPARLITPVDDSVGTTSFRRLAIVNDEGRKLASAIKNAARTMRTAESSTEKEDAEQQLRELLAKEYESRLDSYEDYLENAEKKLKEMRAKVQRRRDAKSDMIDLRVKVLEAEADELGWPAKSNRNYLPGLSGQEGTSRWAR